MFLNHLEGFAVAPAPLPHGLYFSSMVPSQLLPHSRFWGEMWHLSPAEPPSLGRDLELRGRQGEKGAAGKSRSGVEAPPWWPIPTFPCQGGTSCGCASGFCHLSPGFSTFPSGFCPFHRGIEPWCHEQTVDLGYLELLLSHPPHKDSRSSQNPKSRLWNAPFPMDSS